MQLIFDFLYGIHPWCPAVYIALLAVGLLGPAIYCAHAHTSFSILYVWREAAKGTVAARAALFAYVLLVVSTMFLFVGLMI